MLTRYILHTPSLDYTLDREDLRNWEEIKVSFTRSAYDGVVRSFSSQFEFTLGARELLLGIYLRERLKADVSLEIQTLSNNWTWEKAFECPLDFSTVSFDNMSFKINAIDNTLSALIKANKGTKYEFTIGKEISPDRRFTFDRIPMMESATYEFTNGTSLDDGDLQSIFISEKPAYMGTVGSEISVGHTVLYEEDQEDEDGSYLIKAVKDVEVTLDYHVDYVANNTSVNPIGFYLCQGDSDTFSYNEGKFLFSMQRKKFQWIQVKGDPDTLTNWPDPDETWWMFNNRLDTENVTYPYITLDGIAWGLRPVENPSVGQSYEWYNTGMTAKEYMTVSIEGRVKLSLKAGEKVAILVGYLPNRGAGARISHSSFKFSWTAIGETVEIDSFRPQTILNHLLEKVSENKIDATGSISTFDPRLKNTYLMAAESIRGLENARLYSSFTEFCDWMETVFGYVCTIGEPETSRYNSILETGGIINTAKGNFAPEILTYHGTVNTSNILYYSLFGKFCYIDPATKVLYSRWEGSDAYNSSTGTARTDILFRTGGIVYSVKNTSVLPCIPVEYEGNIEKIGLPTQHVSFIHRSELFSGKVVKTIDNVTDLKYDIDSAQIYSAIQIGYDKKDYDSINGRDEFNFNNTYATGCQLSDKTLKLISKYRADCYGIEFAAQKRGEDTTDTTSDSDVFFVLAREYEYTVQVDTDEEENEAVETTFTGIMADRSAVIENALNDRVFNGAFSPMACARANEAYVSLQADNMELTFASSEGNSEITIDGESIGADLTLKGGMLTNGTVEFTCGDTDNVPAYDGLVTVESNGAHYMGYLKSVDIKYTRQEEVKYKLIIKDITI